MTSPDKSDNASSSAMQFDIPKSTVDDENSDNQKLLLNQAQAEVDYGDDQMSYTDLKPEDLTYCKVLSTRHPMFAFINRMLAFQVIQYITSILADNPMITYIIFGACFVLSFVVTFVFCQRLSGQARKRVSVE